MIVRQIPLHFALHNVLILCSLIGVSWASQGDRLPEFRRCVSVCIEENCKHGDSIISLHLRLLLWTCPSNCDYICQHIITDRRISSDPPLLDPVLQFHGKWPFYRVLGIQEPFSVLFSFLNFLAHRDGLSRIYKKIPVQYPLRKYYILLGYIGLSSWAFSMIFHTRDFNLTEKLDYFAAGASVLYGLYYTPIRIFRLDKKEPPTTQSLLRLWSITCILLYVGHVAYLTLWRWDYTYNMAANVAVGVVQNILWSGFSVIRYRESKKRWAALPGLIVAWVVVAMSMELLDFPPIIGHVDAHSLWHLGTVGPTILLYNFLIKDAEEDIKGGERLRLKA